MTTDEAEDIVTDVTDVNIDSINIDTPSADNDDRKDQDASPATSVATTTTDHDSTSKITPKHPGFLLVFLLCFEFIILLGICSKVLMISYSSSQDNYQVNVTSGSNYTYQKCKLDSINNKITNMIDTYAIIFQIFCVIRFMHTLVAIYFCARYNALYKHFSKILCFAFILNIIAPCICLIYLMMQSLISVKQATNGAMEEKSRVRIGFYQNNDINYTWVFDIFVFGMIAFQLHECNYKRLIDKNEDACRWSVVSIVYVTCFAALGLFLPSYYYQTDWKGNDIHNVALNQDKLISLNVAMANYSYQLDHHYDNSYINSTYVAAENNVSDSGSLNFDFQSLVSQCKLFDITGTKDIGMKYYGLRIDNFLDDLDIKGYDTVTGEYYDYSDYFQLSMYCEYTNKITDLMTCSLYKTDIEMVQTTIEMIYAKFKMCSIIDINSSQIRNNSDYEKWSTVLRFTVCYDQIVSPNDMPYQW